MDYREWMREGEDVLKAMSKPTPEEDAALSLELERENGEGAEEGDGPECEWCGRKAPNHAGAIASAPYCSEHCHSEAERHDEESRETYASVHPRPEEVG